MSDHIQIGDIAPRVSLTGDGTTQTFAYPFPIFTDTDLDVYVDGVQQTRGVDYTVSGAGQSAGGTVSFTAAPANDAALTLLRRLAIARTSDFQASGEFRAKVINDELDYQTAVLQQIDNDLGRTVRLQRADADASLELPAAAARAGGVIAFDADGNVTTPALDAFAELAAISVATPNQATPGGSAGTSSDLSAADHAHPLPALADIGIASEAEARAGTDNTKAMTPLRSAQAIDELFNGIDPVARDMAASALAYAITVNDAMSVAGSVGKFWLSDDFESDSLTTTTNATYEGTGGYYGNPGEEYEGTADESKTGAVSVNLSGSYNAGILISPSSNETATGIRINVHAVNSSGNVAAKIYTDNSGAAGTQVGSTGASTEISSTGDHTIPLPDIPLTGGSSYWAVISNVDANLSLSDCGPVSGKATGMATTISNLVDGNSIGTGEELMMSAAYVGDASNITLAPAAASLDAADPSDVLGYFIFEPVDSVTFGTDVVGKVSIDGGSTKVTGTWTKIGDIGTGGEELWRLEADVSGEAGASLTYEITTANNKEIRLHGCVGLIATY